MVMGKKVTYLCGGDLTPGPRDEDCPSILHDWPLPSGFVDASEVAGRRLRNGWVNRKCHKCGKYGWTAGKIVEGQDVEVKPDADRTRTEAG